MLLTNVKTVYWPIDHSYSNLASIFNESIFFFSPTDSKLICIEILLKKLCECDGPFTTQMETFNNYFLDTNIVFKPIMLII